MRMILITLMVFFLCGILVVAYCACVAAGEAEGFEEELFEKMKTRSGGNNQE